MGESCDSDVDADVCESGVYDCTSGTLTCTDDDAFDDSDSDGAADCDDTCVGDDALVGEPCDSGVDADACASGTYECSTGTLTCTDDDAFDDSDSDGVSDCEDTCVGDESLVGQACDSDIDADVCESGVYDCTSGTLICTDDDAFDDSDSDGVADCDDTCVGDESLVGEPCDSDVDADACETGVYDCTSGTLTCTDDEALDDSDSDGVADCDDVCVGDDALIDTACDSDVDSDGCESGTYDCTSGTVTCTDDEAFDDSDSDGIADCDDA